MPGGGSHSNLAEAEVGFKQGDHVGEGAGGDKAPVPPHAEGGVVGPRWRWFNRRAVPGWAYSVEEPVPEAFRAGVEGGVGGPHGDAGFE